MKVLQIIPLFKLAGAEIMCENLCYALRKQGCDVTAVSLYTEHTAITDRLEAASIRVVYLGKKRGFDVSILIRLWKLFRSEQPDVVHTHIYAARYAMPAAFLCGIPVRVHTVHNIAQKEQAKAGKLVNRVMFRYCGVVPVALSKEVKKTIVEVYQVPEQCIPVIYNGIDLSKCQVKHDYGTAGELTIIHIGRFVDAKNHSLILKSFAQFVKRHPKSKLQLLGDGELKSEMEQLAEELGTAQKVEFVGLQSNVYTWLHHADVFVLPSKYEGMPMTLIEAMGTGLPVIATRVGGISDMMTDEEGIFTEQDVDSIAEALERMMDETVRRQYGEKGRKKAVSCFASEAMAKGYMELYKRILKP